MTLENLNKALDEGTPEEIIKVSSELFAQALKKSELALAAELLLLKAICLASKGSYTDAEKIFAALLEKFKNRVSLFHHIRGKIFRSRLYLKKGDIHTARKICDEAGLVELTGTDPLLRSDYLLLKTDITVYEHLYSEKKVLHVIRCLEDYLDALRLSLVIRIKNFTGEKILGRLDPYELLLTLLLEVGNTDRFFYWFDRARRSELEPWLLSVDFLFRNLDARQDHAMKSIRKAFGESLRAYRDTLALLSQELVGAREAPITMNQAYSDEMLRQRGIKLREAYGAFCKQLEDTCLASSINNVAWGGVPVDLTLVQRLMDKTTAGVIYCRAGNSWFAVLVTARIIKVFHLPQTEREAEMLLRPLRGSLEGFRLNLASGENSFDKEQLSSLSNLHKTLFEPLAPFLAEIKQIIVCPDSFLYALTPGFFWNGLQFLEERFQFILLADTRLLLSYLRKQETGMTSAGKSLSETVRLLEERYVPRQSANQSAISLKGDFSEEAPLSTIIVSQDGRQETLLDSARRHHSIPFAFIRVPFSGSSETLTYQQHILLLKKLLLTFSFLDTGCILISPDDSPLDGAKMNQVTAGGLSGAGKIQDTDADDLARIDPGQGIQRGQLFGGFLVPHGADVPASLVQSSSEVIFVSQKPILTPPVFWGDHMFFGGEDTILYAVDTAERAVSLKFKTGDWLTNPPVICDNQLFIGGMDKNVRALSLTDGRKQWEFKINGWVIGGPVCRDEHLFVLSKEGNIYKIDGNTGEPVMEQKLEHKMTPFLKIGNGVLLLLTSEGSMLALSLKNFQIIWEKELSHRKLVAGDVFGDFFVTGDEAGSVSLVNYIERRKRWERNLPQKVVFIDAGDEKSVIVLNRNGLLYGLDFSTGEVLWRFEAVVPSLCVPAIDGYLVWVQTRNGTLEAIDRQSGKMMHRIDYIKNPVRSLAVYRNDLYAIHEEGLVIRIPIEQQGYAMPLTACSPVEGELLSVGDVSLLNHRLLGVIELRVESPTVENQKTAPVVRNNAVNHTVQAEKPIRRNGVVFSTPMLPIRNFIITGIDTRRLAAFHEETLELIWETPLEGRIDHAPVEYGNFILVVDGVGKFYVLDVETGEIKWSRKVCRNFTSPPLVAQGNLYVGGNEGKFYCISAINGSVRWNLQLGQDIIATPVFVDQYVYIAGDRGVVYKVDAMSGDVKFQLKTFDSVQMDMVVDQGNLIVVGSRNCLYCVNLRTGYIDWKYFGSQVVFAGSPVVIAGKAYVGTREGEILVISANRGKFLGKIPPEEPLAVAPLLHRNSLVLGGVNKMFQFDVEKKNYETLFQLQAPLLFPMAVHRNYLYYIEGTANLRRFLPAPLPASGPEEAMKPEALEDLQQEEIPPDAVLGNNTTPVASTGDKPENAPMQKTPPKSASVNASNRQSDDDGEMVMKLVLYSLPLLGLLVLFLTKAVEGKALVYWGIILIGMVAFFAVTDYMQMENNRLRSLMNRFVPTTLLTRLNTEKKTEEREVTILFQDLYNYTGMTEKLPSNEVIELLREIDKITNEIVSKHGGEIMSYLGDAQMIAFNATRDVEHHAVMAAKTAMEINQKIKALGEKLEKDRNKKFPFKLMMGFGINTGKAVIGLRGGANKMEPFVIGDTTNTAVRLQKLTRKVDRQLLVTATTAARLNNLFHLKDLGMFEVKGKKDPTRVFAIVEG